MKKLFLLPVIVLFISLQCHSQSVAADKVPVPVKQSFGKMFPSATGVNYSKEKKDFEVTFKENSVEKSAIFDRTGKWLESETVIRPEDLPKEVDAAVEKNFPGFTIAQVSKVEMPATGVVYEMDLKKDKDGLEVRISPHGDILKKVPWKEEKD
ncbi:MAG: PepSY-like domain-containing protein [Bacteroidetes bacterium]|nr:PepSY-like domain-containing protein [Bacteroidota bacterium]